MKSAKHIQHETKLEPLCVYVSLGLGIFPLVKQKIRVD